MNDSKPAPDSADWWKQIAQRLAIESFDLRRALDGVVNDFLKATEHEGATDCKKYPGYTQALLALGKQRPDNPMAVFAKDWNRPTEA